MKVLVVEDDLLLRDVMVEILSFEGIDVRVAASGNEAKDKLMAELDIDLIISDYMMPNGTGKDLLEFVRQRHPTVPGFYMVTGHADISVNELLRMGAQDCFFKPFDIEKLIEKVHAFQRSIL